MTGNSARWGAFDLRGPFAGKRLTGFISTELARRVPEADDFVRARHEEAGMSGPLLVTPATPLEHQPGLLHRKNGAAPLTSVRHRTTKRLKDYQVGAHRLSGIAPRTVEEQERGPYSARMLPSHTIDSDDGFTSY